MCRKNSDQIRVTFSESLWLQCPFLDHTGSLEFISSWTGLQCESPQVIILAKSKCHYIFWQFFFENFHISSIVRAFDLISKRRAMPEYQLSSGKRYINVIIALSRSLHRNNLELSWYSWCYCWSWPRPISNELQRPKNKHPFNFLKGIFL